jgi:ABC-type Na+ efflux pump permease subunit
MRLQRVVAVIRKEARDYRRNRFVIVTLAILPVVFLIAPMVTLFRIPSSASGATVRGAVGSLSLLMLIVPIVIPPVISSYSVVGERIQGTLEPVLTTPVRSDELLLGKAGAAFVPSVAVAYLVYFIVAIAIRFGAAHVVTTVVWHTPQMLAQILFTPLLAAWSVWVGIGISARSSDVRVAQQLATLAGLPLLAFTSLITFQLIKPTVPLAIGLGLVLLAIDATAWRVVSRMFDRERLVTGSRAEPVVPRTLTPRA